ncbi:MAG: hypothetical protein ACOX56_06695 [Acholeplasmataceae bacterium]|jgi:hypothetical protein
MKSFKKFGVLAALLFVALAVVMLLVEPALKVKMLIGDPYTFATGFQAIFGATQETVFGTFGILEASVVGIIAFVLLIAGGVIPLLPMVPKKLRFLIGAASLLVAGVLFFLVPSSHGDNVQAGVSLILAGVFSLVAFLINGVLAVLNVK